MAVLASELQYSWIVACLRTFEGSHCTSSQKSGNPSKSFLRSMAPDEDTVIIADSDEEMSSARGEGPAEAQPKRKRGSSFQQWAPHEGFGLCRGLDEPCTLGSNDQAAPAGPCGLCDLCNMEDLADLHRHGQGRLTHLLLQLAEPKANDVLERIDHMVGAGIAEDLRGRMRRAHQRKCIDRPRRTPRGPYKKKQKQASAPRAGIWRADIAGESMEESVPTVEELCEVEDDLTAEIGKQADANLETMESTVPKVARRSALRPSSFALPGKKSDTDRGEKKTTQKHDEEPSSFFPKGTADTESEKANKNSPKTSLLERSFMKTKKLQNLLEKINTMLKGSFEEVDEGQTLTIKGVQYKNCCLALSVARAVGGLGTSRTDIRKQAEIWITGLPDYLKAGVAKNEAKPGETLFEDYLNKVVHDDESAIVCLAIPNQNATRVWAGTEATLARSKVLYLKYTSQVTSQHSCQGMQIPPPRSC